MPDPIEEMQRDLVAYRENLVHATAVYERMGAFIPAQLRWATVRRLEAIEIGVAQLERDIAAAQGLQDWDEFPQDCS